jgi:hypothetical protein
MKMGLSNLRGQFFSPMCHRCPPPILSNSEQISHHSALNIRIAIPPRLFENDGNLPGRRKMSIENSVVAIYRQHNDAELAVKELQRGGIDMRKLSIAGKGYHTEEQVVGYYNTGDRMKYWGKVGAFWGGFWGLLFGSALFMIPGLGPILVAGPLVAWIVAGLEGAVEVGALGALGAGLFSIGIPKDSVVKYETALKTDQFLVIVHGTAAEVATAKKIIDNTHPLYCTLHAAELVAA